jgi:5-methylcytosine-specific restriction endonuclease McrA
MSESVFQKPLVFRGPLKPSRCARRRLKTVDRDGGACLRCGGLLFLVLDHVLPRSLGGKNGLYNRQALCRGCDRWKGDRHIDFRPSATVAVALPEHYPAPAPR